MLEQKVRLGIECSLMLKHSKGKIITTLMTCSTKVIIQRLLYQINLLFKPIIRRTKRERTQKVLGDLLSFQKRLVEEKCLPPSKLMLEQAALATSQLVQAEHVGIDHFKCDECDYAANSSHEVKVHMHKFHREQQMPIVTNVEDGESKLAKQQEHP